MLGVQDNLSGGYTLRKVLLNCIKCSISARFTLEPITPVYKSWKKIPGLRWESNPQPPQLRCDALPVELLSPWEQGGGERGN